MLDRLHAQGRQQAPKALRRVGAGSPPLLDAQSPPARTTGDLEAPRAEDSSPSFASSDGVTDPIGLMSSFGALAPLTHKVEGEEKLS